MNSKVNKIDFQKLTYEDRDKENREDYTLAFGPIKRDALKRSVNRNLVNRSTLHALTQKDRKNSMLSNLTSRKDSLPSLNLNSSRKDLEFKELQSTSQDRYSYFKSKIK